MAINILNASIIQESKNDLKIYSSFLAQVSTITRNHEFFLEHFGFIENILIDPKSISEVLGFGRTPFQV